MANESESLGVVGAVDAVVAIAARSLRQQTLALVEANGLHLGLRGRRKSAYLHGLLPSSQPAAARGRKATMAGPALHTMPPIKSRRLGSTLTRYAR